MSSVTERGIAPLLVALSIPLGQRGGAERLRMMFWDEEGQSVSITAGKPGELPATGHSL